MAKESPLLPPFAGRYDGHQLELHATRNDGSLYAATFRVKPRLEWLSDGDSTIVRSDRWFVRALRSVKQDCPRGGVLGGLAGVGLAALLHGDLAKGAAIGAGAGCVSAAAF